MLMAKTSTVDAFVAKTSAVDAFMGQDKHCGCFRGQDKCSECFHGRDKRCGRQHMSYERFTALPDLKLLLLLQRTAPQPCQLASGQ